MEKLISKRTSAFLFDILFVFTIHVWFRGRFWWLIEIVYFLFRDALIGGRSIGKFVVGISVVDRDGNNCTIIKSILRNVIFLLAGVGAIIEFFVMAFSSQGRRLGDRFAKTYVIDQRPHIPGVWFLGLALFLVFLGTGERLYRIIQTEVEAKQLVTLLEDYKNTHGVYPENLDTLNFSTRNYLVYTPNSRGNEFVLWGMTPPIPLKITYSSETKEWTYPKRRRDWQDLFDEELSDVQAQVDHFFHQYVWRSERQKKDLPEIPDRAPPGYIIHLRNGQKIAVEDYWERDGKIHYQKLGGIVGVDPERILMIENKADGTRKRY